MGSSGSKTVTLVANGTAAVTINSIAVAGGSFSGPPMTLPQVLQPNQQMALKVKFSPAAEGDCDRQHHGIQQFDDERIGQDSDAWKGNRHNRAFAFGKRNQPELWAGGGRF